MHAAEDVRHVPIWLRVHLAHAVVESIAREAGADILHVKGPALDEALRPKHLKIADDGTETWVSSPRSSTDADVLVRPSQVDLLMSALASHGWDIVTRFETGSIFEHAASLWHEHLGYVDVHRRFPGIELDADVAFERMWATRADRIIAHRPCPVPDLDAQRLILLLHAAREGGLRHRDAKVAWTDASEPERQRCLALASEFDADIALAAATGRLDDFVGHPAEPLWRLFESDRSPTRLDEWAARFRATPGVLPRARLVARSLLVNTDHLGMRKGRRLTGREILEAYVGRGRKIGREVGAAAGRAVHRLRERGTR